MEAAFFFVLFRLVPALGFSLFFLRFIQNLLGIVFPAALDAVQFFPCNGPGLAKLILFPVLAGIDIPLRVHQSLTKVLNHIRHTGITAVRTFLRTF